MKQGAKGDDHLEPKQPTGHAWIGVALVGALISAVGLVLLGVVVVWGVMDPRRSTEQTLIRSFVGGAALITIGAAIVMKSIRMSRRGRIRLCTHCGYDLRGLDEDALCPECGRK